MSVHVLSIKTIPSWIAAFIVASIPLIYHVTQLLKRMYVYGSVLPLFPFLVIIIIELLFTTRVHDDKAPVMFSDPWPPVSIIIVVWCVNPVVLPLTHCGIVTLYQHISVSTLSQVMACCLVAPSHYMNQSWPRTYHNGHNRSSNTIRPLSSKLHLDHTL